MKIFDLKPGASTRPAGGPPRFLQQRAWQSRRSVLVWNGVSYDFQNKSMAELKWEHEFVSVNRQRGDHIWFTNFLFRRRMLEKDRRRCDGTMIDREFLNCNQLSYPEMSFAWQSIFVRPFRHHRFMHKSADDIRLRFITDRHQVNISPNFRVNQRTRGDTVI